MPKLYIEESTLTDIGNAIRSKTGKTELIPTLNMSTEIRSISSGGVQLPEKAFVISGNCQYRFANNGWNWYIEEFGDQITTSVTNMAAMFTASTNLINITFNINQDLIPNGTNPLNFNNMFSGCNRLTNVPRINFPTDMNNYNFNNPGTVDFNQMFSNCTNLRSADNVFDTKELSSYIQRLRYIGEYNHQILNIFSFCDSLRTVPSWYYSLKLNQECYCPMPWYVGYTQLFDSCRSLDEATNLIVWGKSTDNWGPDSITNYKGGYLDNMFVQAFNNCHRLKNVTFETQTDGTPYTANWANQYIDLNYGGLGWNYNSSFFNNSGITADKEVKDDATYQALKNDPDWWTMDVTYSRYNHDSAVATINSLPNTSAFLATNEGATNTINLKGTSGSATDGGAINTLTEEEIAVATAKGWTVTLA